MRRSSTLQKSMDIPLGSLKSEGHVAAFSCDVTGRYAVLADTQGLAIMDLEYPYQKPRLLHHQTKSKVIGVRCNPHASRKEYVASTSHCHALVWRVDDDYRPLVAGLRKHTRPIKDLCWSPASPDVLCTGGLDGGVHLWDVRAHHIPCQSFSAGPTKAVLQVAWSRQNPSLLASGHDWGVGLWDVRRPSTALRSLGVPGGALRSLDWNPATPDELVTCGGDAFVRFWDVSGEQGGVETLGLRGVDDNVDLVSFAPFSGCGLLSVGRIKGVTHQGQDGRRDCLYLWALPATKAQSAESLQQVCRFEGHAASLVHYDWRVVDNTLYQLVSLDEAQTLRLWRLDAGVLRACGHINPRSEDDPPSLSLNSNPSLGEGVNSGRGGHYDTISPALAARLTPDMLKCDLLPTTVSASQPQRPSQPPSSHTAVSVWQEMVEVEELARQGRLRDVDIEMVDVMCRSMRLSLGPWPLHPGPSGGGGYGPDAIGRSGFRLLVTVEFPPTYPYTASPRFTFRAVKDDEDDEDKDEDEDQGEDQGEGRGKRANGSGENGRGRGEGNWDGSGSDSDNGSPTRPRAYSRRKANSGGGLLSEGGRELLSREVGDIARGALEAQVPCLEKCIRQLERTLAEAAAAGVLLTRGAGSGGPAGEGEGNAEAGGTRLQFAFEGSGAKGPSAKGEEEGGGGGTAGRGGGHQLPCPRYGGAVFSGPNVLVLFNCTLRGVRPPRRPREAGEGGAAAEGEEGQGPTGEADKTPKPPRTYGNLLRRASGAGVGKGFVGASPALTPQPSRSALDSDDPRPHLSDSTFNLKQTPVHGRRLSLSAVTPSSTTGSSKLYSPDADRGGASEGREGGGAASSRLSSPMYSLYFMSPQSRLPLNHPDHDYSFQEPLSRLGLGLSGDDEGFQDEGFAAAAFAQLNTHVTLLDPSPFLPGSPALASRYSLGPCRSPPHPPAFTSSTFAQSSVHSTSNPNLNARTGGGHLAMRGARTRSPLVPHNFPPPPPLPMRRVSEPSGLLPRPRSGGALSSLDPSHPFNLAARANLGVSPSTQSFLRRLAADHHPVPKPPSGRPSTERPVANARTGVNERPGSMPVALVTSGSAQGDGSVGGGAASSQGSGGYSYNHPTGYPANGSPANGYNRSGYNTYGSSFSSVGSNHPFLQLPAGLSHTPTQALRRHNSLLMDRDMLLRRPMPLSPSPHRRRAPPPDGSPMTPARPARSAQAMQPQGGEDPWYRQHIAEARAISDTCRINARAARLGGNEELVHVWTLLQATTAASAADLASEAAAFSSRSAEKPAGLRGVSQRRDSMMGGGPSEGEDNASQRRPATRSWRQGAFGKVLVDRILCDFERRGDVQTLATIVCVLGVRHPSSLLHEHKKGDYDRYLHAYAELLFRWGALELRADVLKRVSRTHLLNDSFVPSAYLGFAVRCAGCGVAVDQGSNFCERCNNYPMKCVVCMLSVRGQSMFCLACGHGGHTQHMQEWFSVHNVCPSGCGCRCLFSQSVHVALPRGGSTPSPRAEARAHPFSFSDDDDDMET